jgi:hypothetical protein
MANTPSDMVRIFAVALLSVYEKSVRNEYPPDLNVHEAAIVPHPYDFAVKPVPTNPVSVHPIKSSVLVVAIRAVVVFPLKSLELNSVLRFQFFVVDAAAPIPIVHSSGYLSGRERVRLVCNMGRSQRAVNSRGRTDCMSMTLFRQVKRPTTSRP